ncbi:hypothetical protein MTO96_032374 [Rhipicephalus appendiculatus]
MPNKTDYSHLVPFPNFLTFGEAFYGPSFPRDRRVLAGSFYGQEAGGQVPSQPNRRPNRASLTAGCEGPFESARIDFAWNLISWRNGALGSLADSLFLQQPIDDALSRLGWLGLLTP